MPFSPAVPFPEPPPFGKSNDPTLAIFTAALLLLFLVGMPFGSPKPPVWTLSGARAMVGGAELPVVKSPVLTKAFGIFGGGMSMTGRLEATSILGAATSSSTLGFGMIGAGIFSAVLISSIGGNGGGVSLRMGCGA